MLPLFQKKITNIRLFSASWLGIMLSQEAEKKGGLWKFFTQKL